MDPACIYINFFHIFNSPGTSKHKENEQTRKTIEWVLEKTQTQEAGFPHSWLHFYGQKISIQAHAVSQVDVLFRPFASLI